MNRTLSCQTCLGCYALKAGARPKCMNEASPYYRLPREPHNVRCAVFAYRAPGAEEQVQSDNQESAPNDQKEKANSPAPNHAAARRTRKKQKMAHRPGAADA